MQKTLVMLKPNPENYTNHTQEYFFKTLQEYAEKVGCIIADERIKKFTEEEAILHYRHLRFVTFFSEIINYITSGDCNLLLVEGENSIQKMQNFKKDLRKKHNCHPGLFDWMYNKKPIYNILHTSDSQKEAKIEVERYFLNK